MLQYKQDKQSRKILGYELRNKIKKLHSFSNEYVLDLGGNSGKLVAPLKTKNNKVISLDIDKNIKPVKNIEFVCGNILDIPFQNDMFDIVIARAVLHHEPDNITSIYKEIKRVLKPSGLLLIEEPIYHNPIAYIIRKGFSTTGHEEGEEPLKLKQLDYLSNKYFLVLETKYFWLWSYTVPHIISRLPKQLKPIFRLWLKRLVKFDKHLLEFDFLKPFCGYVMILCQKRICLKLLKKQ